MTTKTETQNIPTVKTTTFTKEVTKNKTNAYIRIYPTENTIITPVTLKDRYGNKTNAYIKLEIPITMINRGKNNKEPITRIHLHYDKARTFNSFLMLKPDSIHIEYWKNQYESNYLFANSKDFGAKKANIESLTFEGKKGKTKTFQTTINNLHWSKYHRMCRA